MAILLEATILRVTALAVELSREISDSRRTQRYRATIGLR